MQQSIRYKGLSLTPDEMAVENGALALCGNLELHDGAHYALPLSLAHPSLSPSPLMVRWLRFYMFTKLAVITTS